MFRPFRGLVAILAACGVARPGTVVAEVPEDPPKARHWAFQAPRRPPLPETVRKGWARNPIDAFILAGLESVGLSPSPEADRATLLRRLSFDLLGLPPSPEELTTFLDDGRPDAYERLVDRLLASPHFGERAAQHWLDLARYADTDGFEFDAPRPDAWRYRDWVVRAINADLPYDRFVRLQMAGDELEPDNPDAAVATGFHRGYPDMVDLNDQALRRQNALDDITETTASVFLGLTLGCAKCHDHKTDPLLQTDFYRLQAFFTPATFRDDYPIASPEQRAHFEAQRITWQRRVAEVQAGLIAIEAPARAAIAPGPPPGLDDLAAAAFAKPPDERSPEEIRLVFEALAKDKRVKPESLAKALGDEAARERAEALAALEQLKRQAPASLPMARVLDETSDQAPPTFLRRRGDFYSPGPEVAPGFPAVLDASTPVIRPAESSSGRRTALADWLTRPDHPLTARVIVNRLWQEHFGRGLVATPSDFGIAGEPPTHPELLDWLATELPRQNGSLKAIRRLIVTSATYRQSSRLNPHSVTIDPENTLWWRQSRRRLDGEALRDALLMVSGRLNPAIGGPGVFPELPPEILPTVGKPTVWPVSPREADRNRRSLYVFVRRNLRYPFFEAFDRPDTNASCPKRASTTTALQALSLLNSETAATAARGLADRAVREAGPGANAATVVDRLYRLALGRSPDPHEQRLTIAFFTDSNDTDAGLFDLALALLNLNEFVFVD